MRITKSRAAAVADIRNREEAAKVIERDTPDLWREADFDTRVQWVDDLINEWVDELEHDLETGAYDEWRPDPVYQSQYSHACGYYD